MKIRLFSKDPSAISQNGVKANVLFFDRKPAVEKPWTEKLWIYDLCVDKHFTLKENPLQRSDLDEFVALTIQRTATSENQRGLKAIRRVAGEAMITTS